MTFRASVNLNPVNGGASYFQNINNHDFSYVRVAVYDDRTIAIPSRRGHDL